MAPGPRAGRVTWRPGPGEKLGPGVREASGGRPGGVHGASGGAWAASKCDWGIVKCYLGFRGKLQQLRLGVGTVNWTCFWLHFRLVIEIIFMKFPPLLWRSFLGRFFEVLASVFVHFRMYFLLLFVPGVSDLVQNDVGVSDLVQSDVPHESTVNSGQIEGRAAGKAIKKQSMNKENPQ